MNEQESTQIECGGEHDKEPLGKEAAGGLNGDTVNNVSNDETSLALEIMCNQVENDTAKAEEQKERKMMGMQLDLQLARIRAEKQKAKESLMIEEVSQLKEKYSGLLLQKRVLNEDDVDIHTSAREFIAIEKLD
jgi:hypothetical protein